jgi:hypothetical protein
MRTRWWVAFIWECVLGSIESMLQNYARHAQSLKSSVASMHKMEGKAIWQTRKKLSCWSSFVEPRLQSHICEGHVDRSFFRGEWSIRSTWSAWSRWSALISSVHGGSLSAGLSRLLGFVSDLSGRYVHEIVHGNVYVQTNQMNFCACTCAHMRKTDLRIATNKRHARYFMNVSPSIPMIRDSSAEFFLLLHIASNSSPHCTKNQSHVHNSAA